MHDVTKRGLALAVATGGLLITGAAPAVSAVSSTTHPEHPDQAGKKSQPTGASSHHAAIPVSRPQVKQYVGRHKAPGHTAATPTHAPAAHHPAAPHEAAHHPAAPHRGNAPAHASMPHHANASAHASAPQHANAPAHASMPHHGNAPAHASTPHHGNAPAHASTPHHAKAPAHASAPHRNGTAPYSAPRTPAHASAPHPTAGSADSAGAAASSEDFGGGGLLAGNTIEVPVDAPVNICGVVATVLGGGDHAEGEHCVNGPGAAGGPNSSAAAVAGGSPGTLSGNVVQVPVSLPANICGDTVTAVGGQNSAEDILCANEGGPSYSSANAVATSSPGLVSGNVVQVPVDAPLNVCGVTANVVGVFDTAAGTTCVNGGEHHGYRAHPGDMQEHHVGAGAKAVTANSSGAVTGNVLQVPIEAPINACGDSVDLVGVFDSALDNHCVNHTAGGAGAEGRAIGNNGLAAGNVAQLPINIPTEICGVVAAFGAYHDTAAGNSCVNTGAPTTFSAGSATGETGIITGNVAQGSVNAPLQLCGTTLGAGMANSGTEDTGCSTGPAMPPIDRLPPENCPPPQVMHLPQHQEHPHRHRRPTHEEMGQLPHTGSDVLDYAGLGAGALVLGAGALIAARRKSGSAS